jgi:mevalonate kinase
MEEIEVKAPANIKIGGEHSVVYGGPSLSAAIELFATAKISDTNTDKLEIVLQDLNRTISLDSATLTRLYKEYGSRDTANPESIAKYIANNESSFGKEILPYATIAARLLVEQGVTLIGKRVTIHSDVPFQKGYASSAVCSAAFTMALLKATRKRLEDKTAIDIIRDGERIIHKSETAGRIDVGPIYFGGFAKFTSAEGVTKENITTPANFVVIDTGPKPSTAEMVKKVRDLYNSDTKGTTKILKEIDGCVEKGTVALKNGDVKELGRQMSRNQELLAELGVSSPGIDSAVSVATSNGAYGAKLCGGGGGGMAVALVGSEKDAMNVINALKAKGFGAYVTGITFKGAKDSK